MHSPSTQRNADQLLNLIASEPDISRVPIIGAELEPAKVRCARVNLEAAGLADLVELRAGDALVTLRDVGGPIDMVLLDGAYPLYLAVLRLLEPYLAPGAIILAENAHDPDYRDDVCNPANGYLSYAAPVDPGRTTELTIWTACVE